MTLNRSKIAALCGAVLITVAIVGCMTSKVTSVTKDPVTGVFSTNVTTIVNTNNLLIDSSLLEGFTSAGVAAVAQKSHNDPGTVRILLDIEVALDGILKGATQKSADEVLALLNSQLGGGNQNPAIQSEVANIVRLASSMEQAAIRKWGQGVAGQISLELAGAVERGIATGLISVPQPQ